MLFIVLMIGVIQHFDIKSSLNNEWAIVWGILNQGL
jgi:hypothetical protein